MRIELADTISDYIYTQNPILYYRSKYQIGAPSYILLSLKSDTIYINLLKRPTIRFL